MINGIWLGWIGIFTLVILSVAFYRSSAPTRARKKWVIIVGLAGTVAALTLGIVSGLRQHSEPKQGMVTLKPVDGQELQKLEETLLKNPNDVIAMVRLAHLELKQQNFEKVAQLSQKVMILNPNQVENLAHMGMLHFAMGQKEGALHFFEKALKIDPNHAETLLFKSIVESQ